MSDNSMEFGHSDDRETIDSFVEESLEALGRIEGLLLGAEHGETPPDILTTLFRDIHTIKGAGSFLGYSKLTSLTHVSEDLLSKLRDHSIPAEAKHFTQMMEVVDALRRMVENIKAHDQEGDVEVEPLVNHLRDVLQEGLLRAKTGVETPSAPMEGAGDVVFDNPPEMRLGEILLQNAVITAMQLEEALETQKVAQEQINQQKAAEGSDSSVRVSVSVLDRLVNLMGELVLARNQIVQLIKTTRDISPVLLAACQRLDLVTSDLQEKIMKTRMQPMSKVFEKIPRMVRDLCNTTGKKAQCRVEGTATEIDRALVDVIRDPIMHIVRNAVDHGLENTEGRRKAGKPIEGQVIVRAFHEGSMVIIELEDDGGGMDPAKLRKHAITKGILTPEDAGKLSDRESLELVFRPGFSTAAKVTDISGRGVGMDVVKTSVEGAGGQVDLESQLGKGSIFRLKMPLTLAIIPAFLVKASGQRFAVPQASMLELVFLDEDQSGHAIERVRDAFIYRLRGEVLPLVNLSGVLGLKVNPDWHSRSVNIVVIGLGARRYGLVVDEIQDTEEIVIKPLDDHLKRIPGFSGAAVLGDGEVALILDVAGVAAKAGLDTSMRQQVVATTAKGHEDTLKEPHLVFLAGASVQCAIPLELVSRLERLDRGKIEAIGDQEVVQYRGRIMPILRPERAIPIGEASLLTEDQEILVLDFAGGVGLAVSKILDVVDVEPPKKEGGLVDAFLQCRKTVIFEKTTLVLDVYGIVRSLFPGFVHEDHPESETRHHVLLVDDSRTMLTITAEFLRGEGWDVTAVPNGNDALKMIRGPQGARFDILITDIEMDGMDGIRLIHEAKRDAPRLHAFAWTNHQDSETLHRAMHAGAQACIHKLKREELLVALSNLEADVQELDLSGGSQ